MSDTLTIEAAAAKLGVKPDEVAEAGERYGLPWVKTADGAEMVWRKRIHPTDPKVVIREELHVIAGTHGAASGGLAVPEFDPDQAPPSDEPYWPHLIWRLAA